MTARVDEPLEVDLAASAAAAARKQSFVGRLARNQSVVIGALIVAIMLAIGVLAPVLGTIDPAAINPAARNLKPGTERNVINAEGVSERRKFLMGTDSLGRDIYSRVLYGARVSLIVGAAAAAISIVIGLAIGLVSGYIRWVDAIVMRIMDGLMAIPGILLAIGLVSLWGAGLLTVIAAISVPEIPRVVRLVRSVVLTIREEPYVEAAISVGTRTHMILLRHILPNTVAPIIVQATFICASAILAEAILSFLGIGIPPEVPTWGNIMAEGRSYFRVHPHMIAFAGIFLAITVLAVNMLGDGLRDTLDPRLGKRI